MQNEAQYDSDRQTAKISAFLYNNLDKYEYLSLGLKPGTAEQAKFDYSPLGMSLSKAFKKDDVKSVAKKKSDFNYGRKYAFYRFYNKYDKFKEMPLDSKYNRMKEFNKLLIIFKNLKTKTPETQLKKKQIITNINELYKNYYTSCKSDYDTDDK